MYHPAYAPPPPPPIPPDPREQRSRGKALMMGGAISLSFAMAPLLTIIAIEADLPSDGENGAGGVRSAVYPAFAAPAAVAALCGVTLMVAGGSRMRRAEAAGARAPSTSASASASASAKLQLGLGSAFVAGRF